ncbi:MAG: TspO/MBR family protein [Candidatus Bathyarchaeia archaeon]
MKFDWSYLRWLNIIAFIITLIINGLSNTTLIGGKTTAEVSNSYPTLITPAGYVFAIWGIIYALLGIFLIYQAFPSQKDKNFQKQINGFFILTSTLNAVWLFFWQNELLPISIAIILGLLASLIAIYLRLKIGKSTVSLKEKLCVHVPFSVYLGWITIATFANIAVTLVSIGWDGFGLSPETWAILILTIALILDLLVTATRKDIAYSAVFLWALAGIAVNQTANPLIALTAEVAIAIIAVAIIVTTALAWHRRI